mgnify:CR=1 FL=1
MKRKRRKQALRRSQVRTPSATDGEWKYYVEPCDDETNARIAPFCKEAIEEGLRTEDQTLRRVWSCDRLTSQLLRNSEKKLHLKLRFWRRKDGGMLERWYPRETKLPIIRPPKQQDGMGEKRTVRLKMLEIEI